MSCMWIITTTDYNILRYSSLLLDGPNNDDFQQDISSAYLKGKVPTCVNLSL